MFSRFKKSGLASQVAAKLERHLYPHPLDQDSSLIEGKKLRATHGDFPNLNRLYSTPLSATDLIPSPAFSFHPHSSPDLPLFSRFSSPPVSAVLVFHLFTGLRFHWGSWQLCRQQRSSSFWQRLPFSDLISISRCGKVLPSSLSAMSFRVCP